MPRMGSPPFPSALVTPARCLPSRAGNGLACRGARSSPGSSRTSTPSDFAPAAPVGLQSSMSNSTDERTLADALDRHGPTPIIVRSGSGNHQAWYRWNGEKRRIRPDRDRPIDILGYGFVVAPPSHGTKSNYKFIQGGLDDLDHLPVLRGIKTATSLLSSGSMPHKAVTEGSRNDTLWQHCMRSARHCDNFESLLDVAHTQNSDFLPPLTDSEVVKIAKSAWDCTQRGENRFGRHGAFFELRGSQPPDHLGPRCFRFARLLTRQ